MVSGLSYISSEASIPDDEYSQVLGLVFSPDEGDVLFSRLGVRNSLKSLESHAYPVPSLDDFVWFLHNTRPIGLSDGTDIICVAGNFRLDEFTRFDWIRADYNPNVVLSVEAKNDLLGFVARMTLYKCLRYLWDNFDGNIHENKNQNKLEP